MPSKTLRTAVLVAALTAVGSLRAADAPPPAQPPKAPDAQPTAAAAVPKWSDKPSVSGIYPHLAMFNNEGECGTGGVVLWADRLWVITYAPHQPKGSSDKLYEIDSALAQTVRPESIGGTPANRMIHRESNQLFIGPYAIGADRTVRPIPYKDMPGRHTANARHLTDPADKIYYLTMEEGVYEVDVRTLAVKQLFEDGNSQKDIGGSLLPGYHGKGAYSGQGRLIYANNGERTQAALKKPETVSGVLAEWEGPGKDWHVIRRNQFTDVTGPGGIYGADKPETDPIWSIGWDYRSLILMVLDGGTWHSYRLPKGSHSYDGAHGWNTEWPRIRDVGEKNLLMTMHGTFWQFPKGFSVKSAAGIRPRSNYIKVIGDFARWGDKLVMGCDDSAKSEFLNKRKAKGDLAGPGQSQSNLWFVDPGDLDTFGTAIGRGAVWYAEPVKAGATSDPYLFTGYDKRGAHLAHKSAEPVTFTFEVDTTGDGTWKPLRSVTVPANGYAFVDFAAAETGEWVRVKTDKDAAGVTAQFIYANNDKYEAGKADAIFAGLAKPGDAVVAGGLIRARGENKRTLSVAAQTLKGSAVEDVGYYEMDDALHLTRVEDPKAMEFVKKSAAIPQGVLSVDPASVLYVDDAGNRWRLPKGDEKFDALTGTGGMRICREVSTERDLFNAHGTFYELPAENAGGFAKVRPVTTHNLRVHDYGSYRGMLILTGINPDAAKDNKHVVRSDDGKAAVWAGTIDDLWHCGKAVGVGGPWKATDVRANEPSDPYLMTGYDAKRIKLSHANGEPVNFKVEVDLTGTGQWSTYKTFAVPAGTPVEHEFPASFGAYWVRVVADKDCAATVQLEYR